MGKKYGYIDYLYAAEEGETLVITLETSPEGDGVIEILDSNGDSLISADDSFLSAETLTYTFEEADLVTIMVSDFFAGTAFFDLALDPG